MHYYALFYYQRAASLKPYDPKMWQAVRNCFNKMDRPAEAIKALKRALLAGTYYDAPTSSASASFSSNPDTLMDPEVLYHIALMYEKLSDYDEAAALGLGLLFDEETEGG